MTRDKNDVNIVYVGDKPLMNYTNALVTQFDKNEKVIVCARGRFISKAVDVIEFTKRSFLQADNIETGEIVITSEKFKVEKKDIYISCINITLIKPAK